MIETQVAIVGGGVAGLISAIECERRGWDAVLIEKNKRLGGRVGTDMVNGLPLDHGFQVLLTAYPAAQKYLDYTKLDLTPFQSGAVLHTEQNSQTFGDPLRGGASWKDSILNINASWTDLIKIWNLTRLLKGKRNAQIFSRPSMTTMDYLKAKGFSDRVIQRFFKPFFGGIFLENELSTSSRMFEFVFKMFAEGNAAIPALGMSAIVGQLRDQIKLSKIITGLEAEISDQGVINLSDGQQINPKAIIDARSSAAQEWNGCHTFYYQMSSKRIHEPIIHLWSGAEDRLINSWHYLDALWKESEHSVLSATVVNDRGLTEEALGKVVAEEAQEITKDGQLKLLKSYHIPKSLPILEPEWQPDISVEYKEKTPVVMAGDHVYFGSVQGAMMSGSRAVELLGKEALAS